ncbi:molybdopterin-binding protein [Planctomicrobium sp. SH661]|uniref:competence/damage-inducible protein A n=1 Tax=Planctomicrobium sp. SH661 TaxID=3448124 RepID=UPI003F5BE8FC
MHAEIISIGTEITSGAKLDTNSQWLSLQLADLGITTLYHTTVADELDANVQVLRTASDRVDLVLITGGLGPTLDDLTREAMAAAARVGLELDPVSLAAVESFFRSRGREMPVRNRIQAMFPVGATPLTNPIGTAPGIWMSVPRAGREPCFLAAMPGVPTEMKKMFFEQVRPRLKQGQNVIRRARINCFGLGESNTEELLGDLTARGHDPDIGITAHDATITLRIVAQGNSEAECLKKIEHASQQIREKLGNYVFGIEDEELEHIVVRELNARNLTFASVECGTCGLLAEHIAHVDGAAACYRGGTVLPAMTDSPFALAEPLQTQTDADFVLLTGPETFSTDADEHLVSTIQIGLLSRGKEPREMTLKWSGNPAFTKVRAMKTALDLLRLELLGESG